MAGYTKLFSSILDSSIWSEPDHVRLVWITMLAMCDRDGIVEASLPGLVRRAVLPQDKVEDALRVLGEPDLHDRSGVKDGRRIEAVQGGWVIVNYEVYRRKQDAEERREKDAARKARARARNADHTAQTIDKQGVSCDVPPCPAVSEKSRNVTKCHDIAEAEAEASASAEAECSSPLPPAQMAGVRGPRPPDNPHEPPEWSRKVEQIVFKLRDLLCPERDETIIRHLKTAFASGLTVNDFELFLAKQGHRGKHIWAICQAVTIQAQERQRQAAQAKELAERRDRDRIVEAERHTVDAYLAQCCDEELAEMKSLAIAKADAKGLNDRLRDIFVESDIRSEALRRAQPTPEK